MNKNEQYVTEKLFLEKDHEIKQRFKQIDEQFKKIDQRFEQIDRRFEQVDRRFEQVDHRFDGLDQKVNRIALSLIKTQEEVKEIRETMATKSDIQKIIDKVDAFAASTASLDRNAIIHQYRLSVLEKHCGVNR